MKKYLLFFLCTLGHILPAYLHAQQPKLMVPAGHTGVISRTSISPDGKLVLTSSSDNTTKIWSVANGKLVANLEGTSGAFSADGKLIGTITGNNDATIWDATTCGLVAKLEGHTK